MKNIKYHLLSLLVTALVAGSFLSSEKLSGVINPFSLTLLRFLLSALVLLPFILTKKRFLKIAKNVFPRSLIMSLFFAIFFICMFMALETTTALNTGTLYTLVPFITAIVSVFLFKEKLSIPMLGVYLVGAIGTCWVIVQGNLETLLRLNLNKGDILFLLGCISMVCFSVSMKVFHRGEETIVTVFCTLLGGAFWMILALFVFHQPLDWFALNAELALHMLYLALFATLVSTFIIHKTTIVLGPAKVMAYIYLSPVFVAFIMLLFQGKSIPTAVYPGIALSIFSTVILQLTNSNAK
ncbi:MULTISPECIES: DMT family transporter [unclassified Pseudoalteromonas]|uniref:DMT family transporter n=1 Tax=unclassified Pseudoalteromonas TaxID=194690 RepID=UPI000C087E33|nr:MULTISPECIES: DMT family transporter [unclassified Pseudoalteromonas]MDP2636331.1 DMT family transporter [Pseudoalteromonas sp. 1_MG-2023]PHN88604.1 EamA family transporter [Pseudoalteromonas sp. 3D05]